MNIKKIIQTYDTHINNVESRIVTGGVPFIPGKSVYEKANHLRDKMDDIRKFAFLKPRGNDNLSGMLITEPTSQHADLAAIFMDGEGYENCYIEDIIGAFTVIAETGMININQRNVEVNLETQFGVFNSAIKFEDESVKEINITCPCEFKIRNDKTKNLIEDSNTVKGSRAFISGMHMLFLDSDDKIINS